MPRGTVQASDYFVTGIVYQTDRSTVIGNCPLKVINVTSGDYFTITSDSTGRYIASLDEFANAWENEDIIQIKINDTLYVDTDFEIYVAYDINSTNPTWNLVGNGGTTSFTEGITYSFTADKGRTRILTNHYPAGRTGLNITLTA